MSKKILKTRTQFTSTLKKEHYQWLQQHSKSTGIPISRLLDHAVEHLRGIEKIKQGMYMEGSDIIEDKIPTDLLKFIWPPTGYVGDGNGSTLRGAIPTKPTLFMEDDE